MSEEASNVETEGTEQAPGTTPETVEKPDEAPKDSMIPKARLDAEIAKRKELQRIAEEYEAMKKAQADEEAAKKGEIDKFKTERDQYEAEAKQWQSYATARIESLTEQLDDAAKAILSDLEDAPLAKQLSVAEKLAATKKTEPGFGSSGGKAGGDAGGVIPSDVQNVQEFHRWWAGLLSSAEGRLKAADPEFNKKVTAERLRRFG